MPPAMPMVENIRLPNTFISNSKEYWPNAFILPKFKGKMSIFQDKYQADHNSVKSLGFKSYIAATKIPSP
jgi:hypothetical protein